MRSRYPLHSRRAVPLAALLALAAPALLGPAPAASPYIPARRELPTLRLEGRVADAVSGRPIPGAQVWWIRRSPRSGATRPVGRWLTGAEGRFHAGVFPASLLGDGDSLFVLAPGYGSATIPLRKPREPRRSLDVHIVLRREESP